MNKLYLFVTLALLFTTLSASAQQRNNLIISANRNPFFLSSGQSGFIKHNWGLSDQWYIGAGLGFSAFEKQYTDNFNLLFSTSLTIAPERAFALKDVVEATDGRIGYRRERTLAGMEVSIPLFATFGRRWLHRSKRFSLDTDTGLMLVYNHEDTYAWTDKIALHSGLEVENPIEVNEFGDPVYWLAGKSVLRTLDVALSVNVDATYHFNERVGAGLNLFTGWYIFGYFGALTTAGVHFHYTY